MRPSRKRAHEVTPTPDVVLQLFSEQDITVGMATMYVSWNFHQFLAGATPVTEKMARDLARLTGVQEQEWLDIDRRYRQSMDNGT